MNSQPNQPNQLSPQTNWSFLLTILLVASLIGLGVFAYQYWQIREELQDQTEQIENLLEQIEQLEQQLEQATDEAANWQTYRNEDLGFEIKYPNNWIFTDREMGFSIEQNTMNEIGGVGCSIRTSDGIGWPPDEIFVDGEPIEIAGEKQSVTFMKGENSNFYRGIIKKLPLPNSDDYFVVLFSKDERKPGNFYDFAEGGLDEYCINTTYQILSTFKFID